ILADIIDQGEHGYYFTIDRYIGIGFGESYVSVNGLPGWDYKSFGYHGDDGKRFNSSGSGDPYGPLFTTGDTIGVGLNFFEGTSFYTKNGVHLGTAFRNVEGNLYPMIGMRSRGEIIEANFGQRSFKFDIDSYAQFIFKEVRKNEVLRKWMDRIFGDNDDGVFTSEDEAEE
ncbi:14930_t:CDS:2, partial [Acaulospora morrowiae]